VGRPAKARSRSPIPHNQNHHFTEASLQSKLRKGEIRFDPIAVLQGSRLQSRRKNDQGTLRQLSFEIQHQTPVMSFRRKSKILALRALLAVVHEEEQRLLAIINSNETPAEEVSKAFNDLHQLWSRTVLKATDIEDAPVPSSIHLFIRELGSD
jgi:hypothetical protein